LEKAIATKLDEVSHLREKLTKLSEMEQTEEAGGGSKEDALSDSD